MLDLDAIYGMGLLTMGSCPGGGGSNIFAYMLSADLELSIMMTFISTLTALGQFLKYLCTLFFIINHSCISQEVHSYRSTSFYITVELSR